MPLLDRSEIAQANVGESVYSTVSALSAMQSRDQGLGRSSQNQPAFSQLKDKGHSKDSNMKELNNCVFRRS
ncbi:hypothetical protein [Chitinimonas sp. BJB300]|uniref:hypothetical protein n=1 Tax=Chitinimonas sp. BJB300 TaxID=1559339 RepID=UPI000C0CF5D1|nr:hypothetical protein [Chitinimonas sp. BJB300]PHV12052.1 hypothetical protein CSQ89_07895 [Chitinimonas sp. BJB300]